MRRQIVTDYRQLLGEAPPALIYRCVAGSRAYGTANPQSDVDVRGIYVLPTSAYLALRPPEEQVANESNDEVYYALRRFLELASAANPNIIELLYMPADCVTLRTHCFGQLLAARQLFLSKRAYESHVAYALAQIKRARGQNKWVNNPKPEAPPVREEFCWIVPRESAGSPSPRPPYRPVPLAESGIALAECHAAALEHCSGAYRLYHYGPGARGVFRGDNLVCESIPKEDESPRCIGLLIHNQDAYEKALSDHRNYWTWRRHRNEARWIGQERGEVDYDAKNLMHTFRLILSAERIFRDGAPLVRFEGEALAFLLRIRRGEFPYETLIAMAEERVARLSELRDACPLPAAPDTAAIERLLAEITAEWERQTAHA